MKKHDLEKGFFVIEKIQNIAFIGSDCIKV